MTLILPASYFTSWDGSTELQLDIKMSFWKLDLRSRSWPDGHDLTGKCHVAYQSIRMVVLNTPMVFSLLELVSIKSYCRQTASDRSWLEMTLATWRGVTDRNIPTKGVKSTCNLMFESVTNGFLPKEAPFIFFYWLIMERSQNWPDLGSPISKFRDIHFIDTGTDINR